MMKGYDFFTTLPSQSDEMRCGVCNAVCDVKRDVSGPMSWAGAMAKKNTLHDEFCCPYGEDKWHEEALKLFMDIEQCHSPSLKKIMKADLNNMIKLKRCYDER